MEMDILYRYNVEDKEPTVTLSYSTRIPSVPGFPRYQNHEWKFTWTEAMAVRDALNGYLVESKKDERAIPSPDKWDSVDFTPRESEAEFDGDDKRVLAETDILLAEEIDKLTKRVERLAESQKNDFRYLSCRLGTLERKESA